MHPSTHTDKLKKERGQECWFLYVFTSIFFEEGKKTIIYMFVTHTTFAKKLTKWTKLTRVMCTPQHTPTNWKKQRGQELVLVRLYLYFFEEGKKTIIYMFVTHTTFAKKLTKWTKLTRVMCTPQHTPTNWKKQRGQELVLVRLYLSLSFFWHIFLKRVKHICCHTH